MEKEPLDSFQSIWEVKGRKVPRVCWQLRRRGITKKPTDEGAMLAGKMERT